MKKIIGCFFVILLAALSGCSNKEHWTGVVFPDRANLLMRSNSGEFRSLAECESASMEILKSKNALQKGYYECGKNCKSDSGNSNMECEDSVRGNFYKY